jgi:activator of Hsp90 ATPase-like protein
MEENKMTTTADFHVSIAVAASPTEAFNQICRVSEWWTSDIEGSTQDADSNFTVSFADTYVDFRIVEFVPGKSVAWQVTNCYLPWFADKTEWNGTTVRFDISPTADGSQVTLTHVGLTEKMECFEGCSAGWKDHFGESLLALMRDGSGAPKGRQLHVSLSIPATTAEVFEAICRVQEWWSPEFEGDSRAVGDVFTVRFGEQHMSECRVAELALGQRIVWEVTDSRLAWLENKTEWTGTQIIWVIQEREGSAHVTLTHKGLAPETECYNACEKGWGYFLSQSLARLAVDGVGRPGLPVTSGDTNE